MSAGHHARFTDAHRKELERIQRTPWYQKAVKLERRLFRKVEIPWLGGSSQDTQRIYVDHRFAGQARYLGKLIDVSICIPGVVTHEVDEGIFLMFGLTEDGQRYEYDGAHELATCAEEIIAQRAFAKAGLRFDQQAYQDIFKPFLAITKQAPWRNLPRDLNTIPYREDDPALFKEIEREILRQQVAA